MADSAESGQKWRQLVRAILAALAVLVLAVVVPPLVSVHRFEGRITDLIARSLGRPVHLSSVQAHLLPWPGFEVRDLSVAEDPAYGAEPVLHAITVTASIRLLSLFGGHVEIDKIKVDEATLNLVRTAPGRWNLDPLFRNAAVQTGSERGSGNPVRLPYLEATNSRIDFKNGVEKLPFSLVNSDLSMWQDSPGNWRIRLRGQPARTDVSLDQEDTGVVRLEASVRRAPALREMPLHLDLVWEQAQLGQLSRLIAGSDPGWRGDLTGELHLDGTADAAQVAMRLRASGVHREEFVPLSPMDFDANCSFIYHYSARSMQNLTCDSPLGNGRVHIAGEMPSLDAPPQFSLELNQVPVAAALDALRTLRNGVQPDLEAAGTVSGKIVYANVPASTAPPAKPVKTAESVKTANTRSAKPVAPPPGPLSGSLVVENFALSGGGLSQPLKAARMVLGPAANAVQAAALRGSMALPAGGSAPLTINLDLSFTGYQVAVRGQATYVRVREIAHAAGIPGADMLNALAGDPLSLDLVASGPWIAPDTWARAEEAPVTTAPPTPPPTSPSPAKTSAPAATPTPVIPATDTLTGTVTLRNANWQAGYLASHLDISTATLHIAQGSYYWDPVEFTYGPVKGTATLNLPAACTPDASLEPCPPQPIPAFSIKFAQLDVADLQTALLGAREPGTMLSTLIDRLHPASAPPWPHLQGSVSADSVILGPVTLTNVLAAVEVSPAEADVTSLDATLFGGSIHATATLNKALTDRDKPGYVIQGSFEKLDAAELGRLLGLRWSAANSSGEDVSGSGKVELVGYTGADLASSAKGTLHIESRRGAIAALRAERIQPTSESDSAPAAAAQSIPAALAHFDRFTADATIANGVIALVQNQVVSGARKQSVSASISITDPPVITFPPPAPAHSEKHKPAPTGNSAR